jgi:mRNA interferase MazF
MVERFEVYLVNLDNEPSKDAKNSRPCLIVSPNEMNHNVGHVIIAPICSSSAGYPTRVAVNLLNNERSIVLDQLRTVDKDRLVKKIGEIDKNEKGETLRRLAEMFA